MAQWVRGLSTKPNKLSSIPGPLGMQRQTDDVIF